MLEGASAEQQLVWHAAQAVLGQQLLDQLADLFALAPMHHAEQVVGPLGQAPRSLVTEIDAGGLAEATADFVHMGIGNVHHQHGVGTETQGAVLEHQADAAEQSDLLPLFHLLEYLLLAAADLLGQLTVRSGRQRQPGFQQAPQLQCPGFVETSVHRMSPSGKPRSIRKACCIGRSSGTRPVSASISASRRSICARSGPVRTNQRL